jgi:phosphoribosyl-ATP pyrophosphohydrolase
MPDTVTRLYSQILEARELSPAVSRTAKLWRDGTSKRAKKVAEEAVEVAIEAVSGDREAMVRESADLLYNLLVLWAAMDVVPSDVWAEMERRERMLGIAEKLPKLNQSLESAGTQAGDARGNARVL